MCCITDEFEIVISPTTYSTRNKLQKSPVSAAGSQLEFETGLCRKWVRLVIGCQSAP